MSRLLIKPLTKAQNKVLYHLQNGYKLVTDSSMPGACVCNTIKEQYYIGNRLFWNLVDIGFVYQTGESQRFVYDLTDLGQNIKTKPPQP